VSGEASSELGDDEGTEAAKRSLIPPSPSNVNQFEFEKRPVLEFVKRALLLNTKSIINQLLVQGEIKDAGVGFKIANYPSGSSPRRREDITTSADSSSK
jgi:hypothetical protein